METWYQINEEVELVTIKKRGNTSAMLFINGQTICLCTVKNTNDYFWVAYGKNENYLVVYSRGCMVNQIPLKVEAVYDLKNKKIIPVTMKNKVIFEFMCVSKKGIDISVILEFLNENTLQLSEQEEVEDFIRYITAGHENITTEEIKEYVFSQYPIFKEYTSLNTPLSVKEYRKILDEVALDVLKFHIMPNPLAEEYLN